MKAQGYLTIKPVWSRAVGRDGKRRLQKLVMEKVTQTKPSAGTFGAAVVALSIDTPDHVFQPFEIDADIEVHAEQVGAIKVVVEPFSDDPEGE